MNLTVAYITARKEPRVRWFLDSFRRQGNEALDCEVLVISPHTLDFGDSDDYLCVQPYKPKPSVWSGPFRLTSKDYWTTANARNTAAALCETDWIAYVDDLSVLGPDWLLGVRETMQADLIGLGCYQKVNKLVVENGVVVSFEENPHGFDSRMNRFGGENHVTVFGSCLFGCSLAMPMRALEEINGWPENLSDGLGFEDCLTGHTLENCGFGFRYDRRMFTYEADDEHGNEEPMLRWDPGDSPRDKSHAALDKAKNGRFFENDFGEGMNFKELRARTLEGKPFPIRTNPQHEWFTGQPLSEL